MSRITKRQAKRLEKIHNVFIDLESMTYNNDSFAATYGWITIPQEWLIELDN